ncbi:MAG TPA: hypothetical protein VL346_12980 [Acidobacteriaceae bacterium]|nr:hypothetical protein [Acidobacteriaceae bacterium]
MRQTFDGEDPELGVFVSDLADFPRIDLEQGTSRRLSRSAGKPQSWRQSEHVSPVEASRARAAALYSCVCGTAQSQPGCLYRRLPMRQAQALSPSIARIGKLLRDLFDEEVQRALPRGWMELIHQLNEQEKAQGKSER